MSCNAAKSVSSAQDESCATEEGGDSRGGGRAGQEEAERLVGRSKKGNDLCMSPSHRTPRKKKERDRERNRERVRERERIRYCEGERVKERMCVSG